MILALRAKTAAALERFAAAGAPWLPALAFWSNFRSIPPEIVAGVIMVESGGNPDARNDERIAGDPSDDAVGLMQIRQIVLDEYKNATGRTVAQKDLYDPETNIEVGTWYLERLRDVYGFHTYHKTLLAYNNGPGAVSSGNIYNASYADKVLKAAGIL